ncbi:MAG: hypothetical protein CL583_01800 [Alteromonadaceae bacterium]|nr:hypothetical protein [Alteromonadaceae bacterium]|tara:strand:+ start:1101 stop:1433 length:333 start_codon:yes stop_codon:yes gene_type:complete
MRQALPVLALALLLALVACVSLPQTPKQTVAASYVTIESLAETTAIAYRDGHIDGETREEIRIALQESLGHLVEAESLLVAGNDAESQIARARVILEAVQSILQKQVPNE